MADEKDESEPQEGVECPHCGEISMEYPIYGKSPAPLCPNCRKLVSKSDIPDEYIVKKEKKSKDKMEKDDGKVQEILEEEEELNEEEKSEGFFERPQEAEEVLASVLTEFDCKDRFIKMMVRRSKRMGGIHPTDLRNYLKTMKSGVSQDSESDYIADEYSYALKEEEEKARQMGKATPSYPIQQSGDSKPYQSQGAKYGPREHSEQYQSPSQRQNRRNPSTRGEQQKSRPSRNRPHTPREENPKNPDSQYQQYTPGGGGQQRDDYKVRRLEDQVEIIMDELQTSQTEDMNPREVKQMVRETVMEAERQKKEDFNIKDVQEMIQNSMKEMQEKSRMDKLEDKIQDTEMKLKEQQQQFQEMLNNTMDEMKNLLMETQGTPDNVVTEEELREKEKEQQMNYMKEMVEMKKEQHEKELEQMQKERQELVKQLEKERKNQQPRPSQTGEWQSDNAKLTADAINHAVNLAKQKEPIKDLISGVKKLTEEEKEPPTMHETEESEGGVANKVNSEYIEE